MTGEGRLRDSPRKRARATKAEMEHRYAVLADLARWNRPASVRNLYYYRAVVAGLVPKTESGYLRVQRALVELRRRGEVPYEWITDSVRWRRQPDTWDSAEHALRDTARRYRRSLWGGSSVTVEVWCESESIASVVDPVTDRWDVPLLPVRGFSSVTFAYAQGVRRGKHRTVTTRRDPAAARHPDLIRRAWSTPTWPDQWWVADFTYVWTLEGFVYTSFVTDVCSRSCFRPDRRTTPTGQSRRRRRRPRS